MLYLNISHDSALILFCFILFTSYSMFCKTVPQIIVFANEGEPNWLLGLADVRGEGTRNETLRTSEWHRAKCNLKQEKIEPYYNVQYQTGKYFNDAQHLPYKPRRLG